MFSSCWYKFFNSEKEAKSAFDACFKNKNNANEYAVSGIMTGCFGSYSSAFRANKTGDFYWAVSAHTNQIENAVKDFNSQFKNIQMEVVDKVEMATYHDPFEGWKTLPKEFAKKNANLGDTWFTYLLHTDFSSEYSDTAKYILRIPLGFWLRIYSGYGSNTNRLDNKKKYENYVTAAIDHSNNLSSNGSMLSDYEPTHESFYAFDNVELMNELFDNRLAGVPYLVGTGSLYLGSSVLPYCVYYVIENQEDIYRWK